MPRFSISTSVRVSILEVASSKIKGISNTCLKKKEEARALMTIAKAASDLGKVWRRRGKHGVVTTGIRRINLSAFAILLQQ